MYGNSEKARATKELIAMLRDSEAVKNLPESMRELMVQRAAGMIEGVAVAQDIVERRKAG